MILSEYTIELLEQLLKAAFVKITLRKTDKNPLKNDRCLSVGLACAAGRVSIILGFLVCFLVIFATALISLLTFFIKEESKARPARTGKIYASQSYCLQQANFNFLHLNPYKTLNYKSITVGNL